MRHKLSITVLLSLLLAMIALVRSPKPPSAHPLSLLISRGLTTSGKEEFTLVISNASENIVMCANGPPLIIAYLENEIWKTNYSGGSVTGAMLLAPKQTFGTIAITDLFPHTDHVKAVRVGISFVSFSWRGKLGLTMNRFTLLKPATGVLFRLDESTRSTVQWSISFVPFKKPQGDL